MDTEDKRRYLVVCSMFLEIVTPVFRGMLKKFYTSCGFGTLQDFLNSGPILHKLFHLRHRNCECCKDKSNCRNRNSLPLNHYSWNILYDEDPTQSSHDCFCKYLSKPVKLEHLDITLSSLLLLNVCHLPSIDIPVVKLLRQYKNDYLSHNIKGEISLLEYNSLWADTVKSILCLDDSKQDEITRLENRPLDLPLWVKYMTLSLDIYKKYEEIISMLQSNKSTLTSIEKRVDGSGTSLTTIEAKMEGCGTSLTSIEARMVGCGTSLTSIETRMEGCGTSLTSIETRMEGCCTSMSNIEATVQEVVKRIMNMEKSLEGNSVTERNNTLIKALLTEFQLPRQKIFRRKTI